MVRSFLYHSPYPVACIPYLYSSCYVCVCSTYMQTNLLERCTQCCANVLCTQRGIVGVGLVVNTMVTLQRRHLRTCTWLGGCMCTLCVYKTCDMQYPLIIVGFYFCVLCNGCYTDVHRHNRKGVHDYTACNALPFAYCGTYVVCMLWKSMMFWDSNVLS